MNKSESERIATVLDEVGYEEMPSADKAELVILNTCSVRKPAEDRVFGLLHNLHKQKKQGRNVTVAVTGCMIAMHQKELSKRADICFNIKDLENLPSLVNGLCRPNFNSINNFVDYLEVRPKRKSTIHAYVPIMSGCDNFCSFCVVPYTRGREASRNSEEIINEVKDLIDKGYKAITLIGQNVNSYGKSSGENIDFPKLVKKICDIPGDFWIWYVSSHPKDMSKELIELHKTEPKLANYIHFAVQAGSDRILKAMNRHYTYNHCVELTNYIKQELPDVMLSTDLIVGFPGETEEDFEQTREICKEIGFEMVYLGRYSPRPNTRSFHMNETVDDDEKKRREREIMKEIEKINIEKNKNLIGKKIKVLVDKQILSDAVQKSKNQFVGKSEQFKTVRFSSDKEINTGDFVDVEITQTLNWGLEGIA